MWADDDDDVWALTSTGLRRFDGQTWSGPVALPNGDFWYGLSAVSSRDLWIAGFDGVIHGAPRWPATNDPTQILSISPGNKVAAMKSTETIRPSRAFELMNPSATPCQDLMR